MSARIAKSRMFSVGKWRLIACSAVCGAIALVVAAGNPASAQKRAAGGLPPTPLTDDQAIVHVLNRLGYGPRPGDVARVKQIGLAKYIDQQLHPESIDDSREESRIRDMFPTLTMSSRELMEKFPQPRVAAKQEGKTVQEVRQEQQQKLREAQRQSNAATPAQQDMKGSGPAQPPAPGPPLLNYRQMQTPQRVVGELSMAKVDRAIYSERQLYEQMVDFWFNHFNVFANKGQDRFLLTAYERDAIRQHAMGKVRDLLEATAKSPAMLFYLDNWQSVDPDAADRLQQQRAQRQNRGPFGRPRFPLPPPAQAGGQAQRPRRGLNENYGRELMELHTLGVDGGYTQQDVINVARSFTGWTIRTPQRDPQFFFDERTHDPNPKIVLGEKIHAGGMGDGEKVIELLARHPRTAHHISLKLARHFVSDNPPPQLVDRMAATFLKTDGDIRAVLRTMIDSPEFWSAEAYRAKVKTPFELVVSAARAAGSETSVPALFVQWTGRIGEPLYQYEAPTGYPDVADSWVNTSALLNRLNFSLTLAGNRLQGIRTDPAALLSGAPPGDPKAALNQAVDVLLGGQVSPETRKTLEASLGDPQVSQASLDDPIREINRGVIAGLVLGAPEFQRR